MSLSFLVGTTIPSAICGIQSRGSGYPASLFWSSAHELYNLVPMSCYLPQLHWLVFDCIMSFMGNSTNFLITKDLSFSICLFWKPVAGFASS